MNLRRRFCLLLITAAVASSPTMLAAQRLLLKPNQNVLLIMDKGVFSRQQGSQGLGRFVHKFRPHNQTFGPTRIIHHTASELTFRGRTTTCTLRAAGTVTCKNGSSGRWERTRLPIPGE